MAELTTLQGLTDAVRSRGDRPAVLQLRKQGMRTWSGADLARSAADLSHGMSAAGIEPGTPVVLMAANMPEWIASCLGAFGCGAVAVPLDVQSSNHVMEHVLSDSGARVLFTTSDQAERLEQIRVPDGLRIALLDVDDSDERSWLHLQREAQGDLPPCEPEDVAAMFYTSGTTGVPKGVPLTHANLASQVNSLQSTGIVLPTDRMLLALPFHHVYPFTVGLLLSLAEGLPAVIPHALTGPQIVRALNEGEVTLVVGVPRLYRALESGIRERAQASGLLAALAFRGLHGLSTFLRRYLGVRAGRVLLASLHKKIGAGVRLLASGGSALDRDLALALEALGWRVATGYGLTETSPILTLNTPGQTRFGSAGHPIPGVELRIDPTARPGDAGDSPHDEGEIQVRGPNVFGGYHNLPEATEEAFTDDGWFRTGDLGWQDEDGFVHITGRVSTLIVTEAGKNVQPTDVEAAYEQEDAIAEAAVLQVDNRLVAVIVPNREVVGTDEEAAVRAAVQARSRKLPSYQRISDFALTHTELPRTRLGKLRRHLLEERYERARREGGSDAARRTGPMPTDEMTEEDRILLDDPRAMKIWAWLGERFSDKPLTPDSHIQMDLGVDSLDWVDLTLGIRKRVGVELTDDAIARMETVRDLLKEVTDRSTGDEVTDVAPLEDPDSVLTDEQKAWLEPLSPGQRRAARAVWHLDRAMCRFLFRLRVVGLDNLPVDQPFVIAPNHVSYLDPVVLAAAMEPGQLLRTSWGAWTGAAFATAVTRVFARLATAVPLNTDASAVSSLALGAAVLKRQRNLVWFPEGRRSREGRLLEFQRGLGMLLDHFQTPVVPVYIGGAYTAMPVGTAMPRPAPITIVFGAACHPADLERDGTGAEADERIVESLRRRVAELGRAHGEEPSYGRADDEDEARG